MQRRWPCAPARNLPALASFTLERERPAEVRLRLAVVLQQLQMQRREEADRLAQDRDDAGGGHQLGDVRRGLVRAEVQRRGLAGALPRTGAGKQREIVLERLRASA